MELAHEGRSSTESVRLRFEGELLIPKGLKPILYRDAAMSVEEIEAFFVRMDGGEWSGQIYVRGPVRLKDPRADRRWSKKLYRMALWNYEEYPQIVELLTKHLPGFELPEEDDDE